MATQAPAPTPTQQEARARRWPRRLAIGAGVAALVLGGAYWYLGREATLQMLAQRVASASGGKLTLSGVTGSLHGRMHIARVTWRTEDRLVTADKVDIDWSPWQFVSSGLAVSKLYVAGVKVETLRETDQRTPMPATLAPPFPIAVDDARIGRAVFFNKGATTPIDNIRLGVHGDKRRWELRHGAATTPWGQVAASGSIAATRPYKLDASASFTETRPAAGRPAAQLGLRAGGDLETTTIVANGQAGRATGDARLVLAPYAAIPLRTLALNARNIDPGFFNPALPGADLTLSVTAQLDQARNIAGSVDLANSGAAGTLDQQRLPLRALRGKLGGTLSAMRVSDVLIDLGAAGRFTGSGSVQRGAAEQGLGTATFALHTDRLDLKHLHSRMKRTSIAGDLSVANRGGTQVFAARLAEQGMRLTARATLDGKLLDLREAQLVAGKGSVSATGSVALAGDQAFRLKAAAAHFNPAAFGKLPEADLNATVNARGAITPDWRVAAEFALGPSRLLGQPLSGQGRLDANARRISGVHATLSLGSNQVALDGALGAPGDRLQWRLDGRQLDALRAGLYGSVSASGAVSGAMSAPRTSFELEARSLGWVSARRKNNTGELRASGEAWLGGPAGGRVLEARASGSMARLDPAAFGSPLAGSINASFDGSGRFGGGWRATLGLDVRQSTLASSPFWGHARVAADGDHITSADVDLHVGANLATARGAFGAPGDRLDWRIDAPQLAALGPDFGGLLRGSGTLSGATAAPSLSASLDGQNLKFFGKHTLRTLRASASLGSGRGNDDALVADIEAADLASGDTRVAALRLQASGTRAAHALRLAARGDEFDLSAELRGLWTASAWNGTVNSLQNRGRLAFTLQAPTPLRIAAVPGSGFTGLLRPDQIALNGALLRLPSGSVTVDSLAKIGPLWNSRGSAAGVPLAWLAQFSPDLAGEVTGDMTLGAQWALDLRTNGAAGAAPALDGMVRVFRERGDLTVGADVPVVLGLRQFEARADVAGSALRARLDLDGARTGRARVDANAQLIDGRLEDASPLRVAANADLPSIAWLAPLAGQPGMELDGALKVALAGAGTVGTPTFDGTVSGDALALTWAEQGVRLRNGQLRAQLAGDQLRLQRLSFEGRQGTATADGAIRFSGANADMRLRLVANRLEALSRPDRTVVVSGEATLVRDATRFTLDGNVRAERALIELAPQGRPAMSEDVIVLGRGQPARAAKKAPDLPLTIDLAADLGDEFRLRGMGIDATLTGSVRLRRVGDRPPRLNGTIRVASGTYAAYGQKLAIERGILTFSGAFDNPSLNILAVRKRPEGEQLSETNVEAGVEVRGTALAPNAKLVATPNVSDSEKLSWLVLGHGMEGTTGNEAGLLGAAAGALLGGSGGGLQAKLATSLGVDELGLSQAKGLESTVVTVGKRISSRAYLSFEQGASTATSVVRLRYKLNPRITLQFQTGTNTALDILYSWAFD